MHGPRPWRPHLYTVKMERFSKQPMRLAEAVAKKLSEGKNSLAEALAKEYWTPGLEWKFWEYISPEIEVMAQIPWPTPMDRANADATYNNDGDTLKRFVKVLESSGCF
jgi:hypothetical protein